MKIPITKLRDWVSPQDRSGVDLREAHDIIVREYCKPLNVNGARPQECSQCKAFILGMFSMENPRNPAALFTYNARALRARMKETPEKELPTRETSDVGNPFEALLGIL